MDSIRLGEKAVYGGIVVGIAGAVVGVAGVVGNGSVGGDLPAAPGPDFRTWETVSAKTLDNCKL
ncbi:MAG: hypothetical protein ABR987_21710 [Terracidiphilus sp.]|jgi:hypothetical protein